MTIVGGPLDLGTVTAGTTGTPQSYTVAGSDLTADIAIAAPAGVELSKDGGATWSTTLILINDGGSVATTTIQARIASTASVGGVTGSITNTSTGATAQDVTISGTVNAVATPTVTIIGGPLDLGTVVTGTAGTPQSYTISGSNLTADITVAAPAGVEISKDGGATWHSSLTLVNDGGSVSTTTIQARIASTASVGGVTGTITNTTTGATAQDVAVTGTVNAVATPTVTIVGGPLDLGTAVTGTAGTPQTYTIAGSNLTADIIIAAPTGVEISKDGGATWHTSLTLINDGGSVSTTTIRARIASTAAVGSVTGSITNLSTGATGQDVTVSGTVNAVATPTVTIVGGPLDLGTVVTGTAGTPQSYTISGSNLTADITVAAPAGVEISKDGGTTWHTSLTLINDGGSVATTTISARIASTASVGAISGSITNLSTGATSQSVSISGTVNAVATPTLTIVGGPLNLGTVTTGTAGTPQSYTIAGSDLTADIAIAAPAGVEISKDGGSTWHSSLTLAESGGSVATTTIQARIAATATVGSLTANITNTSAGSTGQDVAVSGIVNAVAIPAVTIVGGPLNLGTVVTGTAGTPQTYTVSGSDLTGDIAIVAPAGVEISKDGGTTWHTTLTLINDGGSVATTTISARIASTAAVGSVTGSVSNSSTGATAQSVDINGTVNAVATPTVTVVGGPLNLGAVITGTAGTSQSYTVAGSNLTADIAIVAPAGVEISKDGGTTWHTTLTLAESGGTVATTTIQARIAATATVGSVTGTITDTSAGATTQDVTVSGTVNAVGTPTISVVGGPLDLGTVVTGTAGTPQSYTISGSNLTADIAIAAPTGVEISKDGGATWHTSLTLINDGGSVASTTISARIASTAVVGSVTGNITNLSTGATSQSVSVSGTVNAVATPMVTVTGGPLNLGTVTAGATGTPQSYTIAGSDLTADIAISAPAGVEISKDGGTTWHTTLTLINDGGSVSTTTIQARIASTASVGGVTGTITNTTTGATAQDVAVTGTVNAVGTPTVTIVGGPLNLGTVIAGTAGTPQTYSVSGSDLTADIAIAAPTGVEISKDGGSTWHTSLTLAESGGTVATTTIQARIASTASVGALSGSVTNISTGASTQNVSVGGTVNAVAAPTVTIVGGPLNLGTVVTGTAGTPQTYTIAGSNLTADIIIAAPTGVEISKDGGATWHTTLTLAESGGSVATTTIQARITSTATVGSLTGSISNSSTGATAQDVTASGTVNAVATPTVTIVGGPLDLGTVVTGTAGTPQSYTIAGSNLTSDITVAAPTGVEISKDGGSTWQTSLTLINDGGSVSTTTISARIASTATVGAISGSITNLSTGATSQSVSVSGTVNAVATPTLTIVGGPLNLGSVTTGTAGTPQSYTVAGSDLTADIAIAAPTGVEISKDGGSTWHTTLTLAESGGTVATTTIQARIASTASVGAVSGSVTNISTGASTQSVSVSGTVNAVATPTVTVVGGPLNLGTVVTGTAGTPQTYTIAGSNLTADITVAAPTGVEISKDGGATWHTSLTLVNDGGSVASTTISARIASTAAVGSIIGSITNLSTGATGQDVTVSGTVNAVATPTVTVVGGPLDLGTVVTGTAGTPQTYTVAGSGLTADITVAAPTGVEISKDGGATWHTTLTLINDGGTVPATIVQARIAASAAVGSVTGTIVNLSIGAPAQNVSVGGAVNAVGTPTINVIGGPLDLGTTTAGQAGSPRSFSVGGTNLSAVIVLNAPTGVEISSDGGSTWHDSLTLINDGGSVATTTIQARIAATAPVGSVVGTIWTSSTGATAQNVAVGGTVNAVFTPTLTIVGGPLNLGTVTVGTAGQPQSYNRVWQRANVRPGYRGARGRGDLR